MKLFSLLLSCVFLFGCMQDYPKSRLGQFTAASSFNVRNLDYDKNSAVRVVGEDCQPLYRIQNDSRIQRAMDDAILKGQQRGVTGDLLVNVRIDQLNKDKPGLFGIPETYDCIQVEGELVALNRLITNKSQERTE